MYYQPNYHIETVNDYTFRMRYLSGGVFDMGCEQEGPIHTVELSPFFIGEHIVTQALWKAVMGISDNPSKFIGDDRPVEQVSWLDIMVGRQNGRVRPAFLDQLNYLTKFTRPKGYLYRLPTEAEWEYAAYASDNTGYMGSIHLKELGWFHENTHNESKPVGLKQPNSVGLYDAIGNISEWCMDAYSEFFYLECFNKGVVKNPICNDEDVEGRVTRGGNWRASLSFDPARSRDDKYPSIRLDFIGFRLLLGQNA